MTTTHKLERIVALKTEAGIELGIGTEGGETFKLVATEEQMETLFDELDEILSADSTDDEA